jgi:glutathione S-transferase
MTIRLHGSWFSPFARKVALALELKGLIYEAVDALTRETHAELKRLNVRAEVPVLQDGDVLVVNSSDIIQYLEWRTPAPPLYPAALAERVTARALERLSDSRLDAIMTDCSYWRWAEREDKAPEGLMEAGQRDLDAIFAELEAMLAPRPKPWPFGAPGFVECAFFPHLAALRWMGFTLDARFAATQAWLQAMRAHPVFENDVKRTAAFVKDLPNRNYERRRLFWRGDRIEWLLSRGFHKWLAQEIESGRAAFPA